MKYPCINRSGIEKAVRFDNDNPQYDMDFLGMTVDQTMKFWADKAYTDNATLDKTLMVYRENSDLVYDKDSIDVINKLLSDMRFRNKVRIIHDGSYYTNRIWVHTNVGGKIEFTPEICVRELDIDDTAFQNLSAKKKLNWLYNHFDVVFIQVDAVESREDIIRYIFRDYRRYTDLWSHPPTLMF